MLSSGKLNRWSNFNAIQSTCRKLNGFLILACVWQMLQKAPTTTQPTLKRPSSSVAAVFGDASDEEPEEMPPEAKMRMKNKGR